jgi:hypothetical protein
LLAKRHAVFGLLVISTLSVQKARLSTVGPTCFEEPVLSTMSGFATGMTMNALRGGQMTAAQVATDAFGNALGNSIVGLFRLASRKRLG